MGRRAGDRSAHDAEGNLFAAFRRNGDREKEELGLGAHRGEVRKVHGHRPAAEPFGLLARKEVDALDEHVGRGRQKARRPGDDGRVVAGTDREARGIRCEAPDLVDDPVFARHLAHRDHARGAEGARRRAGAETGISRPDVSGGLSSASESALEGGSGGITAIDSTSSMLST